MKGGIILILEGCISTYFNQARYEELTKPIPGNKLSRPRMRSSRPSGLEIGRTRTVAAQLYDHENKGWEGVDEAYNSPPIYTKQLIHPEKHFSGKEPRRTATPNLAGKLGKGWEQVSANTKGKFPLRTYLEQHLDDAPAAEGWDGDSYSPLTGPQAKRLLIIQIKWDSR